MSPASPAVYRRRRIVVGAALVLIALVATYFPVALLGPVPQASASVTDAPPTVTPATPLVTPGAGTSAIGLVTDGSAQALGGSGSTDPLPIASITKTITALVVLDAKPIAEGSVGPSITMTDADLAILQATQAENGSWASVYPGQVLSEREVIEIMLLESANNYSVTLTNWAFGDTASYLAAATAWLAGQGLGGTAVVDTSGLNPGSRSTTADLLTLARLVLADPVLSGIVGTASLELPQLGTVENTNDLLGMNGIDGVKTGTTDEAGFCLLFSADYTVAGETLQLVGVVLGAPEEDTLHASVLALLQSAEAGFQTVPLVTAGDVLGSYTTPWGASADIVAEESVEATVWSSATVTRSAEAAEIGSGASGTEVGTARYTVEGITLGSGEYTVPLELASGLDGPDAGWKLANPFR
ncbi:D-alanyl-D-alanine carboxypeptidase [Herbiconiux sp. VKM Ac-1786]|uniref:D-alanyl-D-alanine carboxypeptidase family protein n=1 Tax=Herbiconiux sp. VKM Ac-1786 TaxID=2783824 RepID=UPI00188CFC23|nr:D-alanyl-D-alanine carboxypeptidase [Herbiconiux sp. VKM Ac-1786]